MRLCSWDGAETLDVRQWPEVVLVISVGGNIYSYSIREKHQMFSTNTLTETNKTKQLKPKPKKT